MSKKGWGYRNRRTAEEIISNGLTLNFENEEMKVYKNMNSLYAGGYVNIIVMFNKTKKTIKAILSGKDMAGERVKPVTKDITNLKTISNVKKELINVLLPEFCNNSIGVFKKEIEKMTDDEFNKELNYFIEHDIKVMSREISEKKWFRFYNDMFNRKYSYDDFEIVITHNRYSDAMKQVKEKNA